MERETGKGEKLSVLDRASQGVVDSLHARARAQMGGLIRHYLPKLPGMLMGRPIDTTGDMSFYDDKLLSIEPAQGELLYILARSKGVRCAVEFGTSFGVSTIYLAAAIRDAGSGGRVVGTELAPAKVAAARSNIAATGLAARVEILEGEPGRPFAA